MVVDYRKFINRAKSAIPLVPASPEESAAITSALEPVIGFVGALKTDGFEINEEVAGHLIDGIEKRWRLPNGRLLFVRGFRPCNVWSQPSKSVRIVAMVSDDGHSSIGAPESGFYLSSLQDHEVPQIFEIILNGIADMVRENIG